MYSSTNLRRTVEKIKVKFLALQESKQVTMLQNVVNNVLWAMATTFGLNIR